MRGEDAPWSAAAQARLLGGLRAGESPLRLCRELDRHPADVRRRIGVLLGDAVDPQAGEDATTDLDLLWLRVRTSSVLPAPLSCAAVARLWEWGSGVSLTDLDRGELAADPLVPALAEAGRHALRVSAREVVDATGMLDLGDWLDAATGHDAGRHAITTVCCAPDPDGPAIVHHRVAQHGGDEPPRDVQVTLREPARARRALAAAIDDIAPAGPREALARHLGLAPAGETRLDADRHDRALALLDVTRAASLPTRPAAVLRDLLLDPEAIRHLTRALSGGFGVATTLALLGGRHEPEALRLAGRILTRWSNPPNLGRGAIIRTGL